jgi:formamidopyrimidine-DNA glycosylase
MPELPEVETVVRAARPRLSGRTIVAFRALWARQAVPSPAAVRKGIVGRTIRDVARRGKFIVLNLDDGAALLIHLRMSGRLEYAPFEAGPPAHIRAEFDFADGGGLRFCDARKFGRIVFTRDLAAATRGLGVEPLSGEFTPQRLVALLAARRGRIKSVLLDQSVIAGLGNIYADESLFHARIHPLTAAVRVAPRQVRALHAAILNVLTEAVRRNGTSFDWAYPDGQMQHALAAYGREGEACRRCQSGIKRIVVAQRSTHFCPKCQAAAPKK